MINRVYRSTSNRRVTGLCGGLAEHFEIDATWVRLLVVLAALCSFGTTMLVYFIASLFIPKQPYGHII